MSYFLIQEMKYLFTTKIFMLFYNERSFHNWTQFPNPIEYIKTCIE